jgi:hypothetical protein
MTQKHHHEEILGPLDTVEAVPLAEDLQHQKEREIKAEKPSKIKSREFRSKCSRSLLLRSHKANPAIVYPNPIDDSHQTVKTARNKGAEEK